MRLFAVADPSLSNGSTDAGSGRDFGDDQQNEEHEVQLFFSSAHPSSFSSTLPPLLLAFLCLFCILANLATLLLLSCRRPSSRPITSLYVFSLSLADLGIGAFIMPAFLLLHELGPSSAALRPMWLCHVWLLADIWLSTCSLYSMCAVALDRVWNLERPLHAFATRSRRRARQLAALCCWILPALIWVPAFLAFLAHPSPLAPTAYTSCFLPSGDAARKVFWVALPVLYIPATLLIALFLRIAFVVRRHLNFLRQHSYRHHTQLGASASGTVSTPTSALSSARRQRRGAHTILLNTADSAAGPPLPCFRQQFHSSESISKSFGYGIPRDQQKQLERKALLSQGHRKVSRQQKRQNQWRNSPIIRVQRDAETEESTRTEDSQEEDVECHYPDKEKQKAAQRSPLLPKRSASSRPSSPAARSLSSINGSLRNGAGSDLKRQCLMHNIRKLSATLSQSAVVRRTSSSCSRFSENLAELLQREGIAQQVKAAKAVGLVLGCFLLCWCPLLAVWPLRLFWPHRVSARTLHVCLWLCYTCSMLNPLLYAMGTPRARAACAHAYRACLIGTKTNKKSGGMSTRKRNNGAVPI